MYEAQNLTGPSQLHRMSRSALHLCPQKRNEPGRARHRFSELESQLGVTSGTDACRHGRARGRGGEVADEGRITGGTRCRRRAIVPTMRALAVVGLVLVVAALAPGSVLVRAQGDTLAIGAVIRVVTADGQPLDMRAGPALGHPLVTRLAPGETVTVIAEPQS